ncbi:lipocalin family protein [bacterium]|jgi:apolipoprotein D and lipocalin family protein|nr:lipocalin family protein [bacterium]
MKKYKYIILLLLNILLLGCIPDKFTENLPNKNIELKKYLGTWYEIARIPNWFEKNLVGVTATYSIKENGNIKVLNQGYKNQLNGELKKAIGEAWIPDKNKTGRLKVSFFGPFSADYIIIEIDKNYQYALVGSGKDFLWVLSRTPNLESNIYENLLNKAKLLGYDISKLKIVLQ